MEMETFSSVLSGITDIDISNKELREIAYIHGIVIPDRTKKSFEVASIHMEHKLKICKSLS